MTTFCNFASAIFALIAAFLWYRSATVQVPHDDTPNADGWQDASIQVGTSDFIATATEQALWSKRAAFSAAVAAFFQGLAMIVPLIQSCHC